MTGIFGLPLLRRRSEPMNFTKLAFPAAFVVAVLMNSSTRAETKATIDVRAKIDAWSVEMKQIIDNGHGEKRRNDLRARTEKLNAELQGQACTFSDRGFYENHVESQAKALSVKVKSTIDCNSENKIESKVSFTDVNASLYEDDIAYNVAVVSNAAITKWISDWASEEKKAIAETSDLGARAGKVTEIGNAYRAKFQNTRCHRSIPLNILNLADAATKSRSLPIRMEINASCEDYRLNVTFGATLDTKAENDNAKVKPTFGSNDFSWDHASKDMFPTVDKLAKSTDRVSYADKFKLGGNFHNLLNQIRCSDVNAVKSGFPSKMQSLQSVVSLKDLKVSCANDGTHLTVSAHVEAKK
jgi:hypothetical protein